jgi:NADPH:quinone reductase-like Zn-dependent oxidoreductase
VTSLKDKIEAGRYVPVIDRRFPLASIADAYRYVQTGEKAGVVVIDIVT